MNVYLQDISSLIASSHLLLVSEQEPGEKKDRKKETKLGISVGKQEDFGHWFSDLITEAELIEYSDISGWLIASHLLF